VRGDADVWDDEDEAEDEELNDAAEQEEAE
jgi:hypothetical protein